MLLRHYSAILLCACLPAITPAATNQKTPKALAIETTVIPQMVDGGLVRSILVITNADAARNAAYHIDFYGNDGLPLAFPFQTIGKVDHLDGTLAPGSFRFPLHFWNSFCPAAGVGKDRLDHLDVRCNFSDSPGQRSGNRQIQR